jgi:hypothetical protein
LVSEAREKRAFRLGCPHPVVEQSGDLREECRQLREPCQSQSLAGRVDQYLAGDELLLHGANPLHGAVQP